ncbi:5-deoxyglucuronate isomerase [Clostridium tertium]|uniref:5-deoxy-glucuronate isomerase n=1 Tax=Clostridium tertium TaxID=1559 RepID=A0A6N3E1L3_9CLOT
MFKRDIKEVVCEMNGEHSNMLMDVKTYKIAEGELKELFEDEKEMAVLLIDGEGSFAWDDREEAIKRTSLFDEEPTCLHLSKGKKVVVKATKDMEILVQCTDNNDEFESKFYTPQNIKSDVFGEGVLQGTSRRIVRTIFDYNNAPYSNMVMGEVITYPGKWSSYTPHHHPQPEVYYYRFDREQGFGVSIIGDDAFVIKDRSAAFIPGGLVHPQTSAPGYAMYYCWMIRHLENNPWTDRIEDEAHTWMLKEDAKIWEGK